MALRGCSNQTYDMSDLATIAGSQRGVWEELGSVVPWWSVLSSPEFDGTNSLSHEKLQTFYATGEEAVAKALARTSEIARDHGARAVWSGGGIGSTAIDFGCGVGRLARLWQRASSVLLRGPLHGPSGARRPIDTRAGGLSAPLRGHKSSGRGNNK